MELQDLTHKDIARFCMKMREEDKKEVEAMTGKAPMAYVIDTCSAALKAGDDLVQLWSVYNGDNIVAIGGYAITGNVWFLCTDEVKKVPKGFLKLIRMISDGLTSHGMVLTNVAMISNRVHVEFLKRLPGLQWVGSQFELNGELFQRFIILPERER